MAFDTVIDKVQFESALTASANAIREKTGSADSIEWLPDKGFADAIGAIETGGGSEPSEEEWFNDGDTHIWVDIPDGRNSPMFRLGLNGTATVDWGDGTEPDVLTGTDYLTQVYTTPHEYAKPGRYIIRLTVDGEADITPGGSGNDKPGILCYSESSERRNIIYKSTVQKVEVGNNVTLSSYAFSYFYSLRVIKFPYNYTIISSYSFSYCYSLASIVAQGDVTEIGVNAFNVCYGISYLDFTKSTIIPTLTSNSFNSIPADCKIRVPAAMYDEWIVAENWSKYASQIVAV